MVNSGSFDSDGQGDRNAKVGFTQPHNASDSTQSSSPVTASVATPCKTDFSQTADSGLPSVAHAIEPTPTKTEFNSDMPLENFTTNISAVDEGKTSLCCSVPLDKVQGVLTPYHPPATKGDDDGGTKVKQQTRKLLCLYCERSFVSANLRQKHVERIHSAKQNRRVSSRRQNQLTVTPCVYCDKLSGADNTLKDLFQHLINEHSGRYFGCVPCEDRFLTPSLLADHNAANHKTSASPPTTLEKTTVSIPNLDDLKLEEVEIPVKITRSRTKPKPEDDSSKGRKISGKKSTQLKEFRTKKMSVKSSRIALKRRESKRLQAIAKLADTQKKKRQRPTEKKQSNLSKTEQTNSTKSTDKLKTNSSCINPYPEFDHFYRVKKITDHSIDNLKISSLTFDDVFDKAFFNRIKCNIEENLLHHIDGKLFKNEESESRISNFEKVSATPQEIQNSNSENYGCELSLNAVTPVASLSLNSQFGEDFESQIEYGSKPSKKKTQTRKDEIHYKYFTRRKYQASILEHKENRDLSKLDMWTQLVIKKRQQKMLDDKKSPKEILEYTTCDEYKNKLRREELNRVLDRRGPFEDLKEEASKKAALDKLNSASPDNISQESFTEVREVLNEILNRVFAVTDELTVQVEIETEKLAVGSKKQDQREIPGYLNLRRSSSLPSEGEMDKSDKIALICSSQETENFELPTNQVRGKNELVELTGEWARCRMYICAACGAKLPNMKYLLEHKSLYHQNVWVQHYEFVGNQSELYRHLSIPALGKVGAVEESVQCKLWKRSDARVCTKCGKQCNALGELHRHILECGGDWTWMLARKKCKYRPFGAKSRRKRRGLVHRIHLKQKTEPAEKKTYKKAFDGPRQKPSDADTIQRMLANLPAKRSTRKLISLQDGIYRARKKTQINSLNQKKVKCGKVIYKSSTRKETTEKTVNSVSRHSGKKSNSSSSRRSLRSLNKVLASRILDTNATLSVKRKIKALNDNRRTRRSLLEQEETKDVVSIEPVERATPSPLSVKTKSKISNKEDEDVDVEDAPKRSSPRSSPKNVKMSVKKLLMEKISIKSFFPVKKRKNRKALNENQNPQDVENGELTTRSKRKSKEDVNEEVSKVVEVSKTKTETFSHLVRSLSLHKKVTKATPEAQDSTKAEAVTLEDKTSKKRKLKRSFRNVINRVKKLKIDNAPEVKKNPSESAFLDVASETPAQPEKIVIPSVSEAKENTADVPIPAPIVINHVLNENPPIPETIFKLESNNEKSLQAKGELDFEEASTKDTTTHVSDKTQPITIETSVKPKIVPLISPNMKGKIRKPTRGLNDCIAMLTSKLQQKTETTKVDSIFNLLNKPKATTPKSECILRIPYFKSQKTYIEVEETALDLSTKSKDVPTVDVQVRAHEFIMCDYTGTSPTSKVFNSVDKIIEEVVENRRRRSWSSVDETIQKVVEHSVETKLLVRNTVDDVIEFVVENGQEVSDSKSLIVSKERKIGSVRVVKRKKIAAERDEASAPIVVAKDDTVNENAGNVPAFKRSGSVRKNSKAKTNVALENIKCKDEAVVSAVKTDEISIEVPSVDASCVEKVSSELNEAFIAVNDAPVFAKSKQTRRKLGQVRTKKTVATTKPSKLLLETNLDDLLDVKEVNSVAETSLRFDETMTKDEEMKQLCNEDEPLLLENKVVAAQRKASLVASDSEDDVPLAALVKADGRTETESLNVGGTFSDEVATSKKATLSVSNDEEQNADSDTSTEVIPLSQALQKPEALKDLISQNDSNAEFTVVYEHAKLAGIPPAESKIIITNKVHVEITNLQVDADDVADYVVDTSDAMKFVGSRKFEEVLTETSETRQFEEPKLHKRRPKSLKKKAGPRARFVKKNELDETSLESSVSSLSDTNTERVVAKPAKVKRSKSVKASTPPTDAFVLAVVTDETPEIQPIVESDVYGTADVDFMTLAKCSSVLEDLDVPSNVIEAIDAAATLDKTSEDTVGVKSEYSDVEILNVNETVTTALNLEESKTSLVNIKVKKRRSKSVKKKPADSSEEISVKNVVETGEPSESADAETITENIVAEDPKLVIDTPTDAIKPEAKVKKISKARPKVRAVESVDNDKIEERLSLDDTQLKIAIPELALDKKLSEYNELKVKQTRRHVKNGYKVRNKGNKIDLLDLPRNESTVLSVADENNATKENVDSAITNSKSDAGFPNAGQEPPIKIIINKQKTRRKSKSFKKVDLKGQNDLFEDFALVIKKTKRGPIFTYPQFDTFPNDLYTSNAQTQQEEPSDTLQTDLDASVEEMDMELDEIPITSNIITRDNLSFSDELVTSLLGDEFAEECNEKQKKKGRGAKSNELLDVATEYETSTNTEADVEPRCKNNLDVSLEEARKDVDEHDFIPENAKNEIEQNETVDKRVETLTDVFDLISSISNKDLEKEACVVEDESQSKKFEPEKLVSECALRTTETKTKKTKKKKSKLGVEQSPTINIEPPSCNALSLNKDLDSIYAFTELDDLEIAKPIEKPKRIRKLTKSCSESSETIPILSNCHVELKPIEDAGVPDDQLAKPALRKRSRDDNLSTGEIKENNDLQENGRRKSIRSAKVKALEHIHDDALAELTENERNKVTVVEETTSDDITKKKASRRHSKAQKVDLPKQSEQLTDFSGGLQALEKNIEKELDEIIPSEEPIALDVCVEKSSIFEDLAKDLTGFEELDNSIEKELGKELEAKKKAKQKNKFKLTETFDGVLNEDVQIEENNQELRRSRRGSRKVASYNENDLIDPLLDEIDGKRKNRKKVEVTEASVTIPEKPVKKPEKKLNSDELFDLLKASSNENIYVPKAPSFLNNLEESSFKDFNDDNFDAFDDILEKSSLLIQSLDKNEYVDKIYEFTESQTTELKDNVSEPKKPNKKRNVSPKADETSESAPISETISELGVDVKKPKDAAKTNYCDICNKSFIRFENLIKHKRTLTHIQKLSELEAREAAEKSKQQNDSSIVEIATLIPDLSKNEINISDILQDSNKPSQQCSPIVHSSFANNHSLKLADIINDVLNKPVLEGDEKHNSFSDIIMQSNADVQPEYRRYKSLGERKSFDSEPAEQPYVSKTTILEKQISLLENIIENQSGVNYIDDISMSSNSATASPFRADSSNITYVQNNLKPNANDDSFLKPSQYEEISEDSINLRNYEDQKLRKTLNRDEELFLECCSLLKSGSEVSSYSNKKSQNKVLSTMGLKQCDEPEWLERKSLVQKPLYDAGNDYSYDNSRIPTPLGDSYDDDASNSNTISSNWNIAKKATGLDEEDGNKSYTFEEVLNEYDENEAKANSVSKFGAILSKTISILPKIINGKSQRHEDPDKKQEDLSDSKKIITKGARKVFEGLKVSIPTEELNLEEVLNCSPKSKKLEIVYNSVDYGKLDEPLCKPSRTARKSKPVKNKSQFGSNLLFKMNKKKVLSPTDTKRNDDKSHDIYDFEETQDNTDVFTKPDFRTFRNMKSNELVAEAESDTESRDYMDSFSIEAHSITSSVSSSSSKKAKTQENITKKKCMIMGRIFKNAAAKSKIEDIDEEIREIPAIDNSELIENYVADCTDVIKNEAKPKLTEKEINQLFDQLLETKPTENETPNADAKTIKPKPEGKKIEIKKKPKPKNRKRVRTNSESTDDEFSLNKTTKKRTYRKNVKAEDNCINLEQELKECIGVASRKSQRKCTSGKQNVLVEYWSSDDSQFEALMETQRLEWKQVAEAESTPILVDIPVEVNPIEPPQPEVTKPKSLEKKPQQKRDKKAKSTTKPMDTLTSNRRKRAAANPLYHWSSSSEDESQDLIEIKPIRDELEDDEDRPVQHGWIVGDSPKKLVTMLAQAKGKKTDIDCVKEQGKKRTNAVS